MVLRQRAAIENGESYQRYLELLIEAGEILGESLDYHQTIQNVCSAAVRFVADICLLDLGTPENLHLAAAAHRDPARNAELQQAGRFLKGDGRLTRHPVWTVLSTGEPLLVPAIDRGYIEAHSTSAAHAQFMCDLDYRSLMIVPLRSKSQGLLGALTLVRTGDDAVPYAESDLRLAMDLASRCATAIGKSLLHQQTLRIATQFQRAALPRHLPDVPGMTFDAFYEPSSEELLVGGDWYDAFVLPDGRIAITIGDVLGHGTEAAVWMSRLRNSLRATLFTDPDAARALVVVDRLMRLESQDDFSTALVAIIDPVHQTMSCASAGHPGPLVRDINGEICDPFSERSLPLGLRALGTDLKTAQTVTLRPGCFAAFFTDGLLEWNRDIASAWARTMDAIGREDIRESSHPAKAIRDAVIRGEAHRDDVAILTVRVNELTRTEARP